MTDILTVWELCKHGNARPHNWNYMTNSFRCLGGREIELDAPKPYEKERYDDMWRAAHRGTLAPWARDIDTALRLVYAVRGWEVTDGT